MEKGGKVPQKAHQLKNRGRERASKTHKVTGPGMFVCTLRKQESF